MQCHNKSNDNDSKQPNKQEITKRKTKRNNSKNTNNNKNSKNKDKEQKQQHNFKLKTWKQRTTTITQMHHMGFEFQLMHPGVFQHRSSYIQVLQVQENFSRNMRFYEGMLTHTDTSCYIAFVCIRRLLYQSKAYRKLWLKTTNTIAVLAVVVLAVAATVVFVVVQRNDKVLPCRLFSRLPNGIAGFNMSSLCHLLCFRPLQSRTPLDSKVFKFFKCSLDQSNLHGKSSACSHWCR